MGDEIFCRRTGHWISASDQEEGVIIAATQSQVMDSNQQADLQLPPAQDLQFAAQLLGISLGAAQVLAHRRLNQTIGDAGDVPGSGEPGGPDPGRERLEESAGQSCQQWDKKTSVSAQRGRSGSSQKDITSKDDSRGQRSRSITPVRVKVEYKDRNGKQGRSSRDRSRNSVSPSGSKKRRSRSDSWDHTRTVKCGPKRSRSRSSSNSRHGPFRPGRSRSPIPARSRPGKSADSQKVRSRSPQKRGHRSQSRSSSRGRSGQSADAEKHKSKGSKKSPKKKSFKSGHHLEDSKSLDKRSKSSKKARSKSPVGSRKSHSPVRKRGTVSPRSKPKGSSSRSPIKGKTSHHTKSISKSPLRVRTSKLAKSTSVQRPSTSGGRNSSNERSKRQRSNSPSRKSNGTISKKGAKSFTSRSRSRDRPRKSKSTRIRTKSNSKHRLQRSHSRSPIQKRINGRRSRSRSRSRSQERGPRAGLRRPLIRNPVRKSPSRIPFRRQRSVSPSRSPLFRAQRSLSKSPIRKGPKKRSFYGSKRSLSRSPLRQSLSRGLLRQSLSRSPLRRSLSRSPLRRSFSRSPLRRSFSRSPLRRSFSRSPLRRSPQNRNPAFRRRSLSPRRRFQRSFSRSVSRGRVGPNSKKSRSLSRESMRSSPNRRFERSKSLNTLRQRLKSFSKKQFSSEDSLNDSSSDSPRRSCQRLRSRSRSESDYSESDSYSSDSFGWGSPVYFNSRFSSQSSSRSRQGSRSRSQSISRFGTHSPDHGSHFKSRSHSRGRLGPRRMRRSQSRSLSRDRGRPRQRLVYKEESTSRSRGRMNSQNSNYRSRRSNTPSPVRRKQSTSSNYRSRKSPSTSPSRRKILQNRSTGKSKSRSPPANRRTSSHKDTLPDRQRQLSGIESKQLSEAEKIKCDQIAKGIKSIRQNVEKTTQHVTDSDERTQNFLSLSKEQTEPLTRCSATSGFTDNPTSGGESQKKTTQEKLLETLKRLQELEEQQKAQDDELKRVKEALLKKRKIKEVGDSEIPVKVKKEQLSDIVDITGPSSGDNLNQPGVSTSFQNTTSTQGETVIGQHARPAGQEQDTAGHIQDSTGQNRNRNGEAQDSAGQTRERKGQIQDTAGHMQEKPGQRSDIAGTTQDITGQTPLPQQGMFFQQTMGQWIMQSDGMVVWQPFNQPYQHSQAMYMHQNPSTQWQVTPSTSNDQQGPNQIVQYTDPSTDQPVYYQHSGGQWRMDGGLGVNAESAGTDTNVDYPPLPPSIGPIEQPPLPSSTPPPNEYANAANCTSPNKEKVQKLSKQSLSHNDSSLVESQELSEQPSTSSEENRSPHENQRKHATSSSHKERQFSSSPAKLKVPEQSEYASVKSQHPTVPSSPGNTAGSEKLIKSTTSERVPSPNKKRHSSPHVSGRQKLLEQSSEQKLPSTHSDRHSSPHVSKKVPGSPRHSNQSTSISNDHQGQSQHYQINQTTSGQSSTVQSGNRQQNQTSPQKRQKASEKSKSLSDRDRSSFEKCGSSPHDEDQDHAPRHGDPSQTRAEIPDGASSAGRKQGRQPSKTRSGHVEIKHEQEEFDTTEKTTSTRSKRDLSSERSTHPGEKRQRLDSSSSKRSISSAESMHGDNTQNTRKPDNRDLFVVGLTRDITRKDLGNYFQRFGQIESMTVPRGKYHRKYCFIKFVSKGAVDCVMREGRHKMSTQGLKVQHFVKGRFLICELAGGGKRGRHNKDLSSKREKEQTTETPPLNRHPSPRREEHTEHSSSKPTNHHSDPIEPEHIKQEFQEDESFRNEDDFGGKDEHFVESQDWTEGKEKLTSNNKIHISRLGKDISNGHLIKHFGRYGHISQLKRPAMGFAFITFRHEESVEQAINEGKIVGRDGTAIHFLWKDRSIECKQRSQSKDMLDNCQIFVSDLIRLITNRHLKEYFGQFGEILGIDRPKKSYCFITFSNPTSVDRVIEVGCIIGQGWKSWHLLKDKYIECQRKVTKQVWRDRSDVSFLYITFADCIVQFFYHMYMLHNLINDTLIPASTHGKLRLGVHKFEMKASSHGNASDDGREVATNPLEIKQEPVDGRTERDKYCYYCSASSHSLQDCNFLKEQRKKLIKWATERGEESPQPDIRPQNRIRKESHEECSLARTSMGMDTEHESSQSDEPAKWLFDDEQWNRTNNLDRDNSRKWHSNEDTQPTEKSEYDILWIIGDNILDGAQVQAMETQKESFGLSPDTTEVYWFCYRGATLMNFMGNFQRWLQSNPPPTYIIIHLGTNDMATFDEEVNFLNIDRTLELIRDVVPDCVVLWSEVIPRLCVNKGMSTETIPQKRENLNRYAITAVHERPNMYVIRHNFDYYRLFREGDSMHLTVMGLDKLLRTFRVALQMLMRPVHGKCFPNCDGHNKPGNQCVHCSSFTHTIKDCSHYSLETSTKPYQQSHEVKGQRKDQSESLVKTYRKHGDLQRQKSDMRKAVEKKKLSDDLKKGCDSKSKARLPRTLSPRFIPSKSSSASDTVSSSGSRPCAKMCTSSNKKTSPGTKASSVNKTDSEKTMTSGNSKKVIIGQKTPVNLKIGRMTKTKPLQKKIISDPTKKNILDKNKPTTYTQANGNIDNNDSINRQKTTSPKPAQVLEKKTTSDNVKNRTIDQNLNISSKIGQATQTSTKKTNGIKNGNVDQKAIISSKPGQTSLSRSNEKKTNYNSAKNCTTVHKTTIGPKTKLTSPTQASQEKTNDNNAQNVQINQKTSSSVKNRQMNTTISNTGHGRMTQDRQTMAYGNSICNQQTTTSFKHVPNSTQSTDTTSKPDNVKKNSSDQKTTSSSNNDQIDQVKTKTITSSCNAKPTCIKSKKPTSTSAKLTPRIASFNYCDSTNSAKPAISCISHDNKSSALNSSTQKTSSGGAKSQIENSTCLTPIHVRPDLSDTTVSETYSRATLKSSKSPIPGSIQSRQSDSFQKKNSSKHDIISDHKPSSTSVKAQNVHLESKSGIEEDNTPVFRCTNSSTGKTSLANSQTKRRSEDTVSTKTSTVDQFDTNISTVPQSTTCDQRSSSVCSGEQKTKLENSKSITFNDNIVGRQLSTDDISYHTADQQLRSVSDNGSVASKQTSKLANSKSSKMNSSDNHSVISDNCVSVNNIEDALSTTKTSECNASVESIRIASCYSLAGSSQKTPVNTGNPDAMEGTFKTDPPDAMEGTFKTDPAGNNIRITSCYSLAGFDSSFNAFQNITGTDQKTSDGTSNSDAIKGAFKADLNSNIIRISSSYSLAGTDRSSIDIQNSSDTDQKYSDGTGNSNAIACDIKADPKGNRYRTPHLSGTSFWSFLNTTDVSANNTDVTTGTKSSQQFQNLSLSNDNQSTSFAKPHKSDVKFGIFDAEQCASSAKPSLAKLNPNTSETTCANPSQSGVKSGLGDIEQCASGAKPSLAKLKPNTSETTRANPSQSGTNQFIPDTIKVNVTTPEFKRNNDSSDNDLTRANKTVSNSDSDILYTKKKVSIAGDLSFEIPRSDIKSSDMYVCADKVDGNGTGFDLEVVDPISSISMSDNRARFVSPMKDGAYSQCELSADNNNNVRVNKKSNVDIEQESESARLLSNQSKWLPSTSTTNNYYHTEGTYCENKTETILKCQTSTSDNLSRDVSYYDNELTTNAQTEMDHGDSVHIAKTDKRTLKVSLVPLSSGLVQCLLAVDAAESGKQDLYESDTNTNVEHQTPSTTTSVANADSHLFESYNKTKLNAQTASETGSVAEMNFAEATQANDGMIVTEATHDNDVCGKRVTNKNHVAVVDISRATKAFNIAETEINKDPSTEIHIVKEMDTDMTLKNKETPVFYDTVQPGLGNEIASDISCVAEVTIETSSDTMETCDATESDWMKVDGLEVSFVTSTVGSTVADGNHGEEEQKQDLSGEMEDACSKVEEESEAQSDTSKTTSARGDGGPNSNNFKKGIEVTK